MNKFICNCDVHNLKISLHQDGVEKKYFNSVGEIVLKVFTFEQPRKLQREQTGENGANKFKHVHNKLQSLSSHDEVLIGNLRVLACRTIFTQHPLHVISGGWSRGKAV